MYWVIVLLLVMHTVCSFPPTSLVKKFRPEIDAELMRQHHEKCMLLAIIALAFWK